MPAKKTARKKRKPASASRKKLAKSRSVAKKKSVGKKRKVSKKKTSAKKASKKKTVARKKPATKKNLSKKKVAKKKLASKKKVSKKKPAAKKKVSKKKSVTKKVFTKKPAAKKKVSKKKPAATKTVSRKKITKKALPNKIPAARRAPVPRPTPLRKPRTGTDLLSGPIHGIEPYSPKRGEEYMSDEQLGHFGSILQSWKDELMIEVDRTVNHMQDEAANFPDPNDRATQESEFGLELRTRDRERKLLRKITSALTRVEQGDYGFCEETGEEIGLKRLEARPVATLCVEAQERREMAERQFRDQDDRYR
jgi:DnaK suppressor protein